MKNDHEQFAEDRELFARLIQSASLAIHGRKYAREVLDAREAPRSCAISDELNWERPSKTLAKEFHAVVVRLDALNLRRSPPFNYAEFRTKLLSAFANEKTDRGFLEECREALVSWFPSAVKTPTPDADETDLRDVGYIWLTLKAAKFLPLPATAKALSSKLARDGVDPITAGQRGGKAATFSFSVVKKHLSK